MKHVMIDLETLSTQPISPVVAVGATFFDPFTGATGREFYETVSLESSVAHGAVPDMGTFAWWLKQSDAARMELANAELSLSEVLRRFSHFCRSDEGDEVQVWGNGASFDLVILRNAYSSIGRIMPWHFRNERDVRTIVELGQAIGCNPKTTTWLDGIPHHALHDARFQAMYVSIIWQKLTVAA